MKFTDFFNYVKPYSMTSVERIEFLFKSLDHIRENKIEGDYVECGVWKGGNIIGMIKYLEYHNNLTNNIWAYDTFSGMTDPENVDVDLNGNNSVDILDNELVKAYCSLTQVKDNINNFIEKYPEENIKYIVGDVSETLLVEENLPDSISLLRLDTDWYKSTKIELEVLYDRLSDNGILIIDDYGHWKGCKRAVDEFFKDKEFNFEKIDYTGIFLIK